MHSSLEKSLEALRGSYGYDWFLGETVYLITPDLSFATQIASVVHVPHDGAYHLTMNDGSVLTTGRDSWTIVIPARYGFPARTVSEKNCTSLRVAGGIVFNKT